MKISLKGMNRFDLAEERISRLECRSADIMQNEEQRTIMEKYKHKCREM